MLVGLAPIRVESHVGAQWTKVAAIRVRLADAAPTGGQSIVTGAGPTFFALELELQALRGPFKRLGAAQRN